MKYEEGRRKKILPTADGGHVLHSFAFLFLSFTLDSGLCQRGLGLFESILFFFSYLKKENRFIICIFARFYATLLFVFILRSAIPIWG